MCQVLYHHQFQAVNRQVDLRQCLLDSRLADPQVILLVSLLERRLYLHQCRRLLHLRSLKR